MGWANTQIAIPRNAHNPSTHTHTHMPIYLLSIPNNPHPDSDPDFTIPTPTNQQSNRIDGRVGSQ
ncbi:hypothetical protein BDW02DRAFT_564235 [Decorospora gaudefroyi]|uniref:Uncharacterized protein n=1 Tax=Decorospora gaudefroyi TaxID=184978 RepID=A0A6A5KSQ1_9PLEO|nr:hypothetical protein BDW02DRAFT_564235 [Decorospora gaudefroyi]